MLYLFLYNEISTHSQVLEKLHLELDSESARAFMRRLLEDSVRALMPQVMETAHRWAQYWR